MLKFDNVDLPRYFFKSLNSQARTTKRERAKDRERGMGVGNFRRSDVPSKDRGHTILCLGELQVHSRRRFHHFYAN